MRSRSFDVRGPPLSVFPSRCCCECNNSSVCSLALVREKGERWLMEGGGERERVRVAMIPLIYWWRGGQIMCGRWFIVGCSVVRVGLERLECE